MLYILEAVLISLAAYGYYSQYQLAQNKRSMK